MSVVFYIMAANAADPAEAQHVESKRLLSKSTVIMA